MTNYTTVNVVGVPTNGQIAIWNSTTQRFESGNSSGDAIQFHTVPFTAPPFASNWILGPSVAGTFGPDAPSDITGSTKGVLFNAPAGNNAGVYTKALTSPGGAHVVTMFLAERALRTSATDVRTTISLNVMGVSFFAEVYLGFDGANNDTRIIGHKRSNTDYFTGATNLGFPWGVYSGGSPLESSWWRLTFDDTNYQLERYQVGNENWELIWSLAHTCGPIQRVGVTVRSDALPSTPVSAVVLSYVET